MLRIISLIKACCGTNPEEHSAIADRVSSQTKLPSDDVLYLQKVSKSSLPKSLAPGGINTPDPLQSSTNIAQDKDSRSETLLFGNVKPKRKRKKQHNKRASDLTIEIPSGLKGTTGRDNSPIEEKKEPVEEKKSVKKPLKGILKNKGRWM